MEKRLNRSKVDENLTRDLTSFFSSEEILVEKLSNLTRHAKEIQEKFRGKLAESSIIKRYLDQFMSVIEIIDLTEKKHSSQ